MAEPRIAIVGRPNVGKSTFFNRILERRQAIVDATAKITRDRNYGTVEWNGHRLIFIDTGGYIPADADIIDAAVRDQAQLAVSEADLILFMVDGRTDPTAGDRDLAQFVRESRKPAVLVVNKCDSRELDDQVYGFHALGLEPVFPISALSGRLVGDLLDRIVAELDLREGLERGEEREDLRLAIVGMPNVGKSSLVNALLQKEQTIVTPIPGTTRDSIDTHLRWYGKAVTLVDTAGLRKKSRVRDDIEFYGGVRARRSIGQSDVVLVLIDAQKGVGKQDKAILDLVISRGKGLVIVVNKWDLIRKETQTARRYAQEMSSQFKELEHYPVLFISALTRQRVSQVLKVTYQVHEARRQTVSTHSLNQFLQQATRAVQPPAVRGRSIRIKYLVQVNAAPPIFACYANYPRLIPVTYQRYLENQLREAFDFSGVPLKFSYRKK